MSDKTSEYRVEGVASGKSAIAHVDYASEKTHEPLPTQIPKEIVKQYELPNSKVSFLTIFRYATPFELFLQVVGTICAIVAGKAQ